MISKSGGTAETMAQYLVVRAWLEDALGGAAHRHLVFTTDPARGALREIAARDGDRDARRAARRRRPVQRALAGRASCRRRWSASTSRRCSPAPRRAVERAEADDLLRNPAALYAALHWAADADLGARIHVLMPYTDRLREFAEWYRQLWAESLGKRVDRDGRGRCTRGPTPVAAVGATDQHSQVQLFMEGPFDKVITFVVVDDLGDDVPIPPPPTSGRAAAGRPRLPAGPHPRRAAARRVRGHLGGAGADGAHELHPPAAGAERRHASARLIMFFQLATGYAGVWYGIDPFDQPGVELGKQLTYAAMGRPGYEAHAQPAQGQDSDIV